MSIETLTKEIRELEETIEELTLQVQQLQLNSAKTPGRFEVGDKVVLLTGGLVGKYGNKVVVTKVSRRISVVVNERHRVPANLRHDQ